MCKKTRLVVTLAILAVVQLAQAASLVESGPQTNTANTPAMAALQRGLKALDENRLRDAAIAFKSALDLDPKLQVAALGLADVALRSDRDEEVRAWLQKARDIKPGVEVEVAAARYSFSRKEYSRAEAQLKNASRQFPKAFLPYADLGALYLGQLNNPKLAVDAYRQAVAINPRHAGARYGLGRALERTGDDAAALKELQEAARLDPTNSLPWRGIAQLHIRNGRYAQSVAAYDAAIKANPGIVQFYLERASVHEYLGEHDKALADFDQTLRMDARLADAQAGKGMVYQNMRRLDAARSAYQAAIALDPRHALAYNNLAWINAEQKIQLDDALRWAKMATELAPELVVYKDTLGWVYRARGELQPAMKVLEQAVSQAPRFAEAHYHLGIVYSELQQRQKAIAALQKALEVDPSNASAADAKQRLSALQRP